MKEPPSRTARSRAATAHHEAGHAVAAGLHGIKIEHVTVAPKEDAAGHVRYLQPPRSVEQMHRRGMVALAGEAAQQRFNSRSVRRHHGASDRDQVAAYALQCVGSAEQASLLVRLWQVQARDFVQMRWATIQRVAAALQERQVLDGAEVRCLIFQPSQPAQDQQDRRTRRDDDASRNGASQGPPRPACR